VKKWLPLVSMCMGTFMLLIDTTIVQVALPDIATSLHASFSSLQWVIDGYAVALAALLLGAGSVADRIGHRRAYAIGLVLFAAASAMCGAATSAAVLVLFRVIQGAGAAALFSTTTALLNSTYQGADRGKAFGLWAAVASAAAAVGPIVGGLLVQGISWRWIFFVNLPLCVIAIVLVVVYLAPGRATAGRRIDLAGVATFTVAATALLYALTRASDHGWQTIQVYVLIAVAAVAFLAFLGIEARSDHALIDLSLFRRAGFNGVMAAALIVNFAAFAPLTYTSIWLQGVERVTAIGVGLSTLPLAGAAFVLSWLTGRAMHRLPAGLAIASGLALVALGSFISLALLRGDASWPALPAGFAVTGIGTGLAVPSFTAAVLGSVPPDRGGMASGTVSTARQLGFAIGIAVLGSVFEAGAKASLASSAIADPSGAATALSAGQAGGLLDRAGPGAAALRTALHHAALSGLDRLYLVAGILALVSAAVVVALVRSGHPPTVPAVEATENQTENQPAAS
jgi:EmrB/QacA subfamily drug resistance transporter